MVEINNSPYLSFRFVGAEKERSTEVGGSKPLQDRLRFSKGSKEVGSSQHGPIHSTSLEMSECMGLKPIGTSSQ